MSSVLIWEWKEEPVSPLSSEESLVSEDVVLYGASPEYCQDELEDETFFESKAEIASKLLESLEQLEDLDSYIKTDFDDYTKHEPFSNWLEFEDDASDHHVEVIGPVKIEIHPALPDTQSLLQEFENVLDAVEMTHGTLTPPQSPNYKPFLTTLEPLITQPITYPVPERSLLNDVIASSIDLPTTIQQSDVARELAVVDELIRSRAEDLIYPSSPGSNSNSSGSSTFGDCSSDDPEWIPDTVEPSQSDFQLPGKSSTRKRSKPYSRGLNEDKKSRKKEQNKNAATRYRMKKKAEVEDILGEERVVCDENTKLENQITDLQREIKYLKGLMRDLFKAKGLIT